MTDKEKRSWSEFYKDLGALLESWKQENKILADFTQSIEVPENYLDECIFHIIKPFRGRMKRNPITITLENFNKNKHLLDSNSKYKGFTFKVFTEQELNYLMN